MSFREEIEGLIEIRPDLENKVLNGHANIDEFIEAHEIARRLDYSWCETLPLVRMVTEENSLAIMKIMLRRVFGPQLLDEMNLTNVEKVLEMILDGVENINTRFSSCGYTLLHAAVEHHNVELVKMLLDRGADPNISSSEREWSPLSKACHLGFIDVIKMLLEKGADCNIVEKDGFTPFLFALKMCSYEIVDLLMKHGADLKKTTRLEGYTAFHAAVMNATNLDIVDRLLQLNFDLDERGLNGVSPLELAAAKCSADRTTGFPMYQYLLCRGASYTLDFCTKIMTSNKQSPVMKDVTVKHLSLSAYYRRIKGVVVDRILDFSLYHVLLFHRCTRELLQIENSGVLNDDVTMLDILATKNYKQLLEILIECDLTVNYARLKSFPCYGSLVDAVLTERLRNDIAARNAEELFCEIFNFNDRRHIVNQRIMSFLTPQDLQHLDPCNRTT